jgi:filamentous hemagglutinin family protein
VSAGTCAALAVGVASAAGPTGVKLDGTLGGSAATLAGPAYNITQSLGKLAGGNLFFSFQYFNIGTGQKALFTTTSPGIGNVISRVTGGYASTIDGTISLQATFGAPNFFLINPSGVTFTANAMIDVPAAFCVTTANYLKFGDGNFYADPTKTSTLSTAAPEAFGFLGTTRAPVDVTGAALSAGAGGAGEFQIVAGDVTIEGAGGNAGIDSGTGNVRVIATGAQAAEVPLSGAFASNDGAVTLLYGGLLQTTGGASSPAGSIYLSAGTLQVDGQSGSARTGILSLANGDGGGPIGVDVTGGVSIANGGGIASVAEYGAPGAAITLNAGSLTIEGASPYWYTAIGSYAYAAANGGPIVVNVAGAAAFDSGGSILSDAYAAGNSGNVTLTAQSLSVDGGAATVITGISSRAIQGSSGNAGAVSVTTTGATTLSSGGEVISDTYASGNAGDVTFTAASLSVDGTGSTALTGISSRALGGSSGNAGQVSVTTTGATTLSNGAEILAETDALGNAGDATVVAGSLSIDGGTSTPLTGISSRAVAGSAGNAGDVSVTTTGATTLYSGAEILAETDGVGNAGNITVKAGSLSIDTGTSATVTGISSRANEAVSGNAGQISITTTGATTLFNGGQVLSSTSGLGNAGDVTLTAASLGLYGGSAYFPQISSAAEAGSSGKAGDVSVTTSGATTLSDGAQIVSDTYAVGNAGDISLTSGSLNIIGGTGTNKTGIFSSADAGSSGNSGQISVTAGSLTIDGGVSGSLTGISSRTNSGSTGHAGQVTVTTSGATILLNGAEILSTTSGLGAAGDVTLTAGSLSIAGGGQSYLTGISTGAEAGSGGNAGDVTVTTTGATTLFNGGEIISDTFAAGNAGKVTLTAGSLDIVGGTSNTDTAISSAADKGSSGNAGQVSVAAGSVSIYGGTSTTALAGISTSVSPGTSGHAGDLSVTTTGATTLFNGGEIISDTFAVGNAGKVTLNAGSLYIFAGTSATNTGIFSAADKGSSGNAGQISVVTGSLGIDGGTSTAVTGISTSVAPGTTGNAGQVSVTTPGAAILLSGGEILSDTSALGNAGEVSLTAGSADIVAGPTNTTSTGIFSTADTGSSGNAGHVFVTAGTLTVDGEGTSSLTGISSRANAGTKGNAGEVSVVTSGATTLLNGAEILSSTRSSGNAGDVTLEAGSLYIAGGTPTILTGISTSAAIGSSGNAGEVSVTTTGATVLTDGGEILSATFGPGHAGDVTLTAGSVTLDGTASSAAPTTISSEAERGSGGNAGAVTLTAGTLMIYGATSPTATAISSSADVGSIGNAGEVSVSITGAANLLSGGEVASTTSGLGRAGDVTLTAGSLSIDGSPLSPFATGLSSDALSTLSAEAGQVTVTTSGATTLSNGGRIETSTYGPGHAGDVILTAGSLSIDGATSPLYTSIASSAEIGSSGNAGKVSITTSGATTLLSGGEIQSITFALGNAGAVNLSAGSLMIEGGSPYYATGISTEAAPGSSGTAGHLSVITAGATTLLDGGQILSSTYGLGHAGDVTLTAASLNIDAGGMTAFTGISSSAAPGSSGNAGEVSITTSGVTMLSGSGEIQSATFASGNAGDVTLKAGSLSIVGDPAAYYATAISTEAGPGSSGFAGVVAIDVSGTAELVNGGKITSTAQGGTSGQPGTLMISAGTLVLDENGLVSIENDATVANPTLIVPTQINIKAGSIQMNGGKISADSTGNINASSIDVSYSQSLYMDPSTISTASQNGNGGPITITGQGPLWMQDSNITTSVRGTTNGNGGDINISVPDILLSTGAIQANTQAPRASGGDVTIDAQALIPSYNSYVLGGSNSVTFVPTTPGLNVVQAAAPDGVSGALSVTVPTLDLGNSLVGLIGAPARPTPLGRSLCTYRRGSSLSMAGRGGLPVSARDPLWVDADEEAAEAPMHEAAPSAGAQPGNRLGALAIIACR